MNKFIFCLVYQDKEHWITLINTYEKNQIVEFKNNYESQTRIIRANGYTWLLQHSVLQLNPKVV